jgi:23S rRNA (uridine2552-2'-O)-methyltransferase
MKKVQDRYFQQAKREGFAARSAYKLEEIDRGQRLLRPGQRVLDLGCAPGSWLQVAAERVGMRGRVVGVDVQPVSIALPSQVRVVQGDAFSLSPEALLQALAPDGAPDSPARGGARFDLVLSDMAPKTTGIPSADAARSAELALRALSLAQATLRPGGDLLVKVFQGARLSEVRKAFAAAFERVSLEKPPASRGESVEIFLLGRGLRPVASAAERASNPAARPSPPRAGNAPPAAETTGPATGAAAPEAG